MTTDDLDELFDRYWDGALTADEHDRLAARLAADPVAREQFQLLCLHAVTLADRPAAPPPEPARPKPEPARWTRRGLARLAGGGVAAGLLAAAGRWAVGGAAGPALTDVNGTVTVSGADGRPVPPARPVPPGATVATHGIGSSAVLRFADGTDVTLMGDSAVALAAARRVTVVRGVVGAAVPARAEAVPLALSGSRVALNGVSGAALSLGEVGRASEVTVYHGAVAAARPTGEPMGVVRQGELLVVQTNGDHRTQPIPPTPTTYAMDLGQPLPGGWEVGTRAAAADGFVLRPAWWPDPYHGHAVLSQIRSDARWARGFFALSADSEVHVRYRVDRPGRGQMCLCVRAPGTAASPTGVLDTGDDAFADARPGEWRWLRARAGDMLDRREAPRFAAPWVAFLIIFNTYEDSLGLEVAELRAVPPPRG